MWCPTKSGKWMGGFCEEGDMYVVTESIIHFTND